MWNRRLVEALWAVKLWKTLALAVLALGLGAYIFLVEKPRMKAETAPKLLLKLDPQAVSGLRLRYPDKPTIELSHEGEQWWIKAPLATEADKDAVERLLKTISEAKVERRIGPSKAQSLETYGLAGDGSHARISISLSGGKKLPDIIVGRSTPVGFSAFARIEGDKDVIVTPLIFHTGVNKKLFDLRKKKLFTIDPANVVSLTVSSPERSVVLMRAGDKWRITAPIEDSADVAEVRTMLSSFNTMQALAFYDGKDVDRAKFGLTKPQLSVQAELGEGKTAGFQVGTKQSEPAPAGYYLERKSDGQVVKVPEWVKVRFDKDLAALRDKHLFNCDADKIARINFERRDAGSFSLLMGEEGKWTMEPAAEGTLKQAMATRSRNGLATLAGKEIVADRVAKPQALAAYGLDSPVVEVEIALKDGSSCGRAMAGIVDAGTDSPRYYLKRAGDGMVMSAPEYLYSRMDVKRDDFLAAKHKKPAAGS